jgi:hypothetical protein
MLAKRKKTLMMKVFVVFVTFAFATAGFAARIIPTGNVSIIEDGKVVGQFSQEGPLPDGALLRCEAQCTMKLDDLYMVAEPGTVISISSTANQHELLVKKGTVYYSATDSTRAIKFNTPAGNATTRDLNVTDDDLRGYVRVAGNETEIGVIGGGSMMLETDSGEVAITSGRQLTMALTGSGTSVAATSEQGEGLTTNQKYALGAVGAAIAVGGIIVLASSSSDGDGNGGSPAVP